jgi:glucosamine kinase
VEVGQGCVRRALYLGVDGGATRSRARLRDAEGKLLAETTGAAANIHVDFVAAEAALRALVDATLTKAGLNQADSGSIAMGLGLAGFKGATDQTRIAAAFPGFSRVQAANDATTACVGAHAGADGGLIIAGTGSAAVARVGNKETIIGGRGFALGDDGSGSHIGLEAMRFAMRAYDRIGPESALTQDLISHFNNDPVAMMNWALSAKPGDFGGFAPRVFEHAASQDPIALEIVWAAAHAIGVLTRGVFVLGAERVALVGGVGEALRPYFEPDMAARLQPPLYDPTDGAILFVGGAVASEGQVAP